MTKRLWLFSFLCASHGCFAAGPVLQDSQTVHAKIMHPCFLEWIKSDSDYQVLKRREARARELLPGSDALLKQIQEEKRRFVDQKRRMALREGENIPVTHKNIPSAAEMSGALHWAHRQGIKGQGVDVLVLEISTQIHSERLTKAVSKVQGKYKFDQGEIGLHPTGVVSALLQVAPKSNVTLASDTIQMPILTKSGDYFPIVSRSIGEMTVYGNYWEIDRILRGNPTSLLVTTYGNSASYPNGEGNLVSLASWINDNPEKHRLIFAKSMGPDRAIGPVNKELSEAADNLINKFALTALGEKVLVECGGERYAYKMGTSYSAPTIAGAAALIKSKYPHFTAEQLQQVLLESADRTFLYSVAKYPHILCWVYDPQEVDLARDKPKESGFRYITMPFNPHHYGKGVLNIRNALIYADLLDKNPEVAAHVLREVMLGTLHGADYIAARTLQEKWRAYQGRKERKALTSSVPPTDSAHGESIPSGASLAGTDDSPSHSPTDDSPSDEDA